MRIEDSESVLHDYLSARDLGSPDADVRATLLAIVDWYVERRADDADPMDEDGDMLLFQWGTYDWGEGRWFEVDLTRQLVLAAEEDDDAIMQLSSTYRYAPDEANAALGKGSRWCGDLAEVPAFREFVERHPVTAFAASTRPASRTSRLGNAG